MLDAAVWQETVRRAGSEGEGYDLDPWIWGEGGGLVSGILVWPELTSKGDLVASSAQCTAA